MRLFGSYTYTWWQMGVFKLALLAIGMIGGAYLATFVLNALWVFITIAVVASAYIIAISLSGKNKK
jgi:hypothetical protein